MFFLERRGGEESDRDLKSGVGVNLDLRSFQSRSWPWQLRSVRFVSEGQSKAF